MLEALYLALDVLAASFVATLLTRFVTSRRLEDAVAGVRSNPRRWAVGFLALALGVLLLVPGTVLLGRGDPRVLTASTLGAYAAVLAGVYVLWSGTWPGDEAGREGST